jgi:hypothetical protein
MAAGSEAGSPDSVSRHSRWRREELVDDRLGL